MNEISHLSRSGSYPQRAELLDHDKRMTAARRAAGWYLGSREWADQLIGYYLDPENALSVLADRMRDHGVEPPWSESSEVERTVDGVNPRKSEKAEERA